MADEIVCKRGEDRAPGAATRERDEILGRLSPAFRLVVEFVREQKNSSRRILTAEEVRRMFEAAESQRDRAIMSVLHESGPKIELRESGRDG